MNTKSNILILLCVVGATCAPPHARADFTFGTPTNLGSTVNSSSSEWPPSISGDGLSLFFCSDRPGGYGNRDIWVSTRPTVSDPWSDPVNLGPNVNSSSKEAFPSISADGLSLFFESTRSGGYGRHDLWVTKRPTTSEPWGAPVNLGPTVNSSYEDATPGISADGLSLLFESDRPGGYGDFDIWVTTRPTDSEPWGTPVNMGPTVNSPAWDGGPNISVDGLSLYFWSDRVGGHGRNDIWLTTRKTIFEDWGTPVNPGSSLNTSSYDDPGSISPDGLLLYFESDRPGGEGSDDLWQAPIIPIVDFNADGVVDAADVRIMIDHWGEDYPLCDIGPFAWGDGIVDVEDLKVLAEHLFEEVDDPTLVAHWPLDEAEGMVVTDRAGDNDGYALGDPVWQPDGGQVNGALQLDGVDDFISVPAVLNPSDGKFSVLAWIRGGAPGQVVLSQVGAANWLMADAEGRLMTELTAPGRDGAALQSQTIITDGQWHRIGFVWDGFRRMLYCDGVIAAEDLQDTLKGSGSGQYIGAGQAMEPGAFWSGLIDDVRIYNRAVRP